MKIIKPGYESVIRDHPSFPPFPPFQKHHEYQVLTLTIGMSRARDKKKTKAKTLLIESSVAFKYSAGQKR